MILTAGGGLLGCGRVCALWDGGGGGAWLGGCGIPGGGGGAWFGGLTLPNFIGGVAGGGTDGGGTDGLLAGCGLGLGLAEFCEN